MRRLPNLNLKLLFRNPRILNPPTPLDQAISSSSSSSSSAPSDLFRSLSLFSSNTFRSCHHAAHGGATSSSLGFLAYQFLSKHAMWKAKCHNFTGLIESGIQSLKVSRQRRPRFDSGRFSSSGRGFWRCLVPTPDGMVLSLIGANVAVYFLWRNADPTFMRKQFMISMDNFKSGRLHTLLTSAFSHKDFDHIVTNMIGLYFFGTSIARLFGPEFLLKLYVAGALGGSIFFLLHKALLAPSPTGTYELDYSRIPGLGASAAVNAIILLDVFLFPKNIIYLNLIIPVPAILMGAFIIGSDLWRVKKGEVDISGSAHLGGAVVAALVWGGMKKGWI